MLVSAHCFPPPSALQAVGKLKQKLVVSTQKARILKRATTELKMWVPEATSLPCPVNAALFNHHLQPTTHSHTTHTSPWMSA